jgi:hypothetical protein
MAKKQKKFNPGMVVHACNFRLRQEEHEFQVSLGLCLQIKRVYFPHEAHFTLVNLLFIEESGHMFLSLYF